MSFGTAAASYVTVPPTGTGSLYADMVITHVPLLYWRLNDADATEVADSSGNERNGVYAANPAELGGASILADGGGTSASFVSGENAVARLTSASWMNVNQMTAACIYLSSYTDQPDLQMLVSRYHDSDSDRSWWLYRENSEFKFGYQTSGGQVTIISSGVIEQLGQIYYIAAWCGDTDAGIRVYSLGTLLGSATTPAATLSSSSASFAVAGCDVSSYGLTGILQEVSYFDRVLPVSDIDALATEATAPHSQWLNRTAGVAARNGTSGHTLSFPTVGAGSFLVAVVHGDVVSTTLTPGWTKRLGPADNSEYAVFTRMANAGDASLELSHNGSNYPLNYAVYEFPAGTSWVTGAGQPIGSTPALTGLPGTPLTVFAGTGFSTFDPGDPSAATTWGWRWFEDIDIMTPDDGTTGGVYTTLGWRRGVAATTVDPGSDGYFGAVYDVIGNSSSRTSIVFALNIP